MMDADADFITRLIGFGLSEKESRTYLHLLKYGSTTPSPLAKSLHTYREDIHRTLNGLIEKGMVKSSLDSPTVYAAVDLDTALESALKKHEAELREMEAKKRELQEFAAQQHFRPSDEVATFKVIKSIKELVAVMLPILTAMDEEWVYAVPSGAAVLGYQFGMWEAAREFTERGGRIRGIMYDIPYSTAVILKEFLASGVELRYLGREGLIFTIFDRAKTISGISGDVVYRSFKQPLTALWTDDPTYARYLMSTFETLWEQSTPAAERIKELLAEGPPQA